MRSLFLLMLAATLVAAGCDNEKKTNKKLTGEPCIKDAECRGENPTCLDYDAFKDLTEGDELEIPGGYCSRLGCLTGLGEDECGKDGFCFNLQQYVDAALGACLKVCESDSDCRSGYACLDGAGDGKFEPLPHKACLPPELACLLDIPLPSCPPKSDGGSPGDGGNSNGGDGDA